jgi:3-hydroxybutyryl-CoA dehydrogenase
MAEKVLVVGAGTMGAGIAQLCAQRGFETWIADISMALSTGALSRIGKNLDRRVEKGRITEAERDEIMSRLYTVDSCDAAADAQVVIESVLEDMDIKRSVFRELDRKAGAGTLLATNTTSLSISDIAAATGRPEQVVQIHFFNPPPVMKLVEIMPGEKTAPETLAAAVTFARRLGKDPVVCKAEAPAGIVSRILGQMLNEATWLVEQGVAEPADIDRAMMLGANHPMGPLQLIDMIGIDIHRAKMQTLHRVLNDPRYRHPPIIDRLVEEGNLGRKTGKGFYTY